LPEASAVVVPDPSSSPYATTSPDEACGAGVELMSGMRRRKIARRHTAKAGVLLLGMARLRSGRSFVVDNVGNSASTVKFFWDCDARLKRPDGMRGWFC
jgi:hypothetical protein